MSADRNREHLQRTIQELREGADGVGPCVADTLLSFLGTLGIPLLESEADRWRAKRENQGLAIHRQYVEHVEASLLRGIELPPQTFRLLTQAQIDRWSATTTRLDGQTVACFFRQQLSQLKNQDRLGDHSLSFVTGTERTVQEACAGGQLVGAKVRLTIPGQLLDGQSLTFSHVFHVDWDEKGNWLDRSDTDPTTRWLINTLLGNGGLDRGLTRISREGRTWNLVILDPKPQDSKR